MSGVARRTLAFACLSLLAFASCNRKHDSNNFLATAPAIAQALLLIFDLEKLPADGASTARVEARIDPNSDPDRRKIRFKTTLGSFVEPGSSQAAAAEVVKSADVEGKAVSYLRSAATVGVAVVTLEVIGTDGAGNEVVFAAVSGEVEFTPVQEALSLALTPSSNFADGVSPVTLVARISDDSPLEWNQVTFGTSLGFFDGVSGQQSKTVNTDANREARVQLTSLQVGTANVTATIAQFTGATVSQLATFAERNPNAVKLSAPSQVPADGASEIGIVASIAAGLTARSVSFTTTGGTFVPGGGATATATADASNEARVRLKADTNIRTVLVTATVDLGGGTQQSDDLEIQFIRAVPTFIELEAAKSPVFKTADKMTTITARMSRDIGTLSKNTVVNYSVEKTNGTAITDMEFQDVTRGAMTGSCSAAAAECQESTAVFFFGDTMEDLTGGLIVIVKAKVAGSSAVGQVSITVNPP